MDLMIGRDGENNRLAVQTGKQIILFGEPGSVPMSVSRYKREEHTAHCRVTVDDRTHALKIANLNSRNYTWVDGRQVFEEPVAVDWDSRVQLGGEYYNLDLTYILGKLKVDAPVSVAHLERVWTDYERAKLEMQIDQQKKANQQKLQGILSQASMAIMFIPSIIPNDVLDVPVWLRAALILGALTLGVVFYIRGGKTDNIMAVKLQELERRLQHDYVCPECGNFVGNKPYKLLLAQGQCPYCRKYYRGSSWRPGHN